MVDDGIKSALLFLNYNIGASEREEYEEKQKKTRKASSSSSGM